LKAESGTFLPIPTGEIPPPVLDGSPEPAESETPMPRVLLQSVGSARAAQRVVLQAALFAALAALELALFLHISPQEPLVVYQELPRAVLVEVRQ